jgi:hypothetical protein
MNDKELVEKFLDRNYILVADDTYFSLKEIDTNRKVNLQKFKSEILLKIFGDFIGEHGSCLDIFNVWFNIKSEILVKKLHDYVEEQDFSMGSVKLLNLCLKKFSNDKKSLIMKHDGYNTTFIKNYIENKYKEKILIPLLKKHLEEFKGTDGSRFLINSFHQNLKFETFKLQEYCVKYLNDWYCESILGNKLKTFLRELVITLGPRNWIVTWIGHGPLNRQTLLNRFPEESEEHHVYILKMFDEWYEKEVMDTSERLLNRNNYGDSFPTLNLERNF